MKLFFLTILILLFYSCADSGGSEMNGKPSNPDLDFVQLPDGFKIDYYARGLNKPRAMDISPGGTVYIGSLSSYVYALIDSNKDFIVDTIIPINTGTQYANGVAFVDGDLYVANISRIIKYTDIENHFSNPQYTVVTNQLPTDSWHGYKVLRQGPDQKLYLPIGAPCNTCDSTNLNLNIKYGSMNRLNLDGSGFETIATGIRNSVGYDWNPFTQELWFTDNGPDYLGNTIPPDELNRIPETGKHFGFPFVHGDSIIDLDFGGLGIPPNFMPPVFGFDAHSASLGMRFYTGSTFPAKYQNQIFVAHHGSWNRVPPVGYRIVIVYLNGNEAINQEIFAEGWLVGNGGNQSLGRPVDIEIMSDGSMLVSDDLKGNIYRIWYDPN